MFERFTEQSREAVDVAQEEALLMRHERVGTEHLLVGVARAGDSEASALLREHGLTGERLRAEVVQAVGLGDDDGQEHKQLTPAAHDALEAALGEAMGLGHERVEPAHLLLAILRQPDALARRILMGAGAPPPEVRAEIIRRLAERRPAPPDLVLHQHPFASYCQKVLIALYELHVPFRTALVEASREELAAIWPMASIPVLHDHSADLVLPESTTIIEYVDRDAALIPSLQARLWDRVFDEYVATPMQKIVGDSLRPEGRKDPEGVTQARATLDTAYAMLDTHLADRPWAAGERFTVADCAAAPALFYTRAVHRWDEGAQRNVSRYYRDLMARPSVARVVEEARPYREIFPLPWPEDMDVTTR